MKQKPIIGLLLGDPTGIGPEIIAKLLSQEQLYALARIVVIGDRRIFKMGQQVIGTEFKFPVIQKLDDMPAEAAQPVVLDFPTIAPEEVTYKKVNAKAGKSVYETLEFTLKLALDRKIDGFVFGPFHKEAMGLGGCPFHAEIELFKARFNRPKVHGEINVLEDMWTTRVTSHVPLKDVSALITRERILETIDLLNDQLTQYGIEAPRIAVTALNPHAGENGKCGTEEIETIAPAIQAAKENGMNVAGPYPADTIFLRVLFMAKLEN